MKVRVAAYEFAPYYSKYLDSSLTSDLIDALNAYQDTYEFVLQEVPAATRYRALSKKGCCDVMFFEDIDWGWNRKGETVQAVQPLIQGSDRFVALKQPGRTQAYFKDLTDKRLGGINGYHYSFTNYHTDRKFLEQHYNMYLADSHVACLRLLLHGRLDVIVLNDEFLAALQNAKEDYLDKLLISQRHDQQYKLSILVADNKAVSATIIRQLIRELGRNGTIDQLFRRYNLSRFQIYRSRGVH
ncbi:amino acid ABC transporter substrate-binding protein [Idiomarina tyrosinivorans]|uniref:Amino acid ABC transporter substrate-binding protein n=1 Tax=Idiomarina tyrosinivorans TaxID=1445662 RepID=A0A432ZQP2_9GAMM|nr:transporter substrate-binding domain-containing protein [Idiomarina tyrosinivorans]RUO80162.1 amino acid ABC transporter substrate-binding protein [Idiomarina tyrosinivorans]